MNLQQNIAKKINSSWKRTFFVIWIGQAFSLLGSNLVQFALVWWLTKKTGSAVVLALATLAALLPQVFLGPFAGALVDRWNRKRVMILADSLISLVTLVIVLLFWSGVIQPWHIYITMFLRSLGQAFHWPAMEASTSLMVPKKQLARISGFNQMLRGLLNITSPPLGALLLEVLPIYGVLSVDIFTALLAILPLLFVSIPQPQKSHKTLLTPVSLWLDVKEGFLYLKSWNGMMLLALLAAIVNFLLNPGSSLLPLLVVNFFEGGVWELGWIESIFGIGTVAGGLILSTWGGFKRKIYTTLFGVIGMGIGMSIVTLAPSNLFLLAIIGTGILGFMNPICNGSLQAIMMEHIAPEMQGRVFSMLGSLASAMSPLGMLIAAPVAELLGIHAWLLVGAIGCLGMGIGGFFIPAIVHIEENHHLVKSPINV